LSRVEAVQTPYDELVERLRIAARPDRPAAPGLQSYLELVRRHAYRIGDEDVAALKAAGHTDDEIFEQTVSVAVAEGLRRLEAGLGAIG
jgi:alkylhydroperoxidase family enzyme